MPEGTNLGALWVPIVADVSKVGPAVREAGKNAKDEFSKSTRDIGKDVTDEIERSTRDIPDNLEKTGKKATKKLKDVFHGAGSKIGAGLGAAIGTGLGSALVDATTGLHGFDGIVSELSGSLGTLNPLLEKLGIDTSGLQSSLKTGSDAIHTAADSFGDFKTVVEGLGGALSLIPGALGEIGAALGAVSGPLAAAAGAVAAIGGGAGWLLARGANNAADQRVANAPDAPVDITGAPLNIPGQSLPDSGQKIVDQTNKGSQRSSNGFLFGDDPSSTDGGTGPSLGGALFGNDDAGPSSESPSSMIPAISAPSGTGAAANAPASGSHDAFVAPFGNMPKIDKATKDALVNHNVAPGGYTQDQAAQAIISAAQARGLSKEETLAALSVGILETGLGSNSKTNVQQNQSGTVVQGLFQQDSSYNKYGSRTDPNSAARGFVDQFIARGGTKMDPYQGAVKVQVGTYNSDYVRSFRNRAMGFYNRNSGLDGAPDVDDAGTDYDGSSSGLSSGYSGGGSARSRGGGGGGGGSSGGSSGPAGTRGDPIYVLPASGSNAVGGPGGGGGSGGMPGGDGMPGGIDPGQGLSQELGLDGSVFSGFGGSSGNPMDFGISKIFKNVMGAFGGGDGSSLPGMGGLIPGAGAAISSGARPANGAGSGLGPANGPQIHGDYNPTTFNVTQNGVGGDGVSAWKEQYNAQTSRASAMTAHGAAGHG